MGSAAGRGVGAGRVCGSSLRGSRAQTGELPPRPVPQDSWFLSARPGPVPSWSREAVAPEATAGLRSGCRQVPASHDIFDPSEPGEAPSGPFEPGSPCSHALPAALGCPCLRPETGAFTRTSWPHPHFFKASLGPPLPGSPPGTPLPSIGRLCFWLLPDPRLCTPCLQLSTPEAPGFSVVLPCLSFPLWGGGKVVFTHRGGG